MFELDSCCFFSNIQAQTSVSKDLCNKFMIKVVVQKVKILIYKAFNISIFFSVYIYEQFKIQLLMIVGYCKSYQDPQPGFDYPRSLFYKFIHTSDLDSNDLHITFFSYARLTLISMLRVYPLVRYKLMCFSIINIDYKRYLF